MVDFINEVEEELRKDKYNALLRQYGPYIVGLIIAIVVVTGVIEFKKYKFDKNARMASTSYVSAQKMLESGDLDGAFTRFSVLAEIAPDGYAGLSLSQAAGIKQQMGDLDGAVTLFDKAAAKFTRPVHKDLASLKACYILLDQGRFGDVKARVASLTNEERPYWELAQELLAQADLGTGDTDAAKDIFSYLSTVPGVLKGVSVRSQRAHALLKSNEPVPAPKPETALPNPKASTEDGAVNTPTTGLTAGEENKEE
ncbi:MAG: tetratricopeptide repeat protein [Robiginitomaculum sp.]